jgi:hypothetical protein
MSLKDEWLQWWEIIESKGLLMHPIGKVAAQYNLRWPTTRYMEPISLYRFDRPWKIKKKLDGFGRVKYHVIVECVRLLAEGGDPGRRWTHFKRAN